MRKDPTQQRKPLIFVYLACVLAILAVVIFSSQRLKSHQGGSIPGKTTQSSPGAKSQSLASTGTSPQNASAVPATASPVKLLQFPSTPRPTVPERELIASDWKNESSPAFAAFASWTDKYLAAPADQRAAMIDEGVDLARARRTAMAEMIEKDPRRALADAVPMFVRNQLPSEVVDQLEKRVSGIGDLYRIGSYNTDGGQKPSFDYAKVNGDYYNASRYGGRATLFELKGSSIHGVAVDNELAVLDTPVYQPEVGETLKGKPVNTLCLVSGNVATSIAEGTVTDPATAPLQIGENELIILCSLEHAKYIENLLRDAEANGKPAITNGSLNMQYLIDNAKNPIFAYGGAGGTAWPNMPSTNLTYGNKRAIVYRVQMQNWTAFPSNYTESFLSNTIIGNQCSNCYSGMTNRTVSNQLWEFSWGKVAITNVDVTPVMLMPKTRDQYTNNYWGVVLDDAKAAGQALGYDPNNYEFFVVVHSDLQAATLNACAWGGGGAVWVNECWSVGVLVHEFGHVFGLPHANGWTITDGDTWSPSRTHVEYMDPTDPMGQGNGNYRNHYNSFFKYFIHWYPDTMVQNVTTSGTYRVFQFDDFNAPLTNTMGLLLRRDPLSSYWIALRGGTTTGNFANAAYIAEVQNNKNDTHLLDFNNPNSANSDGGLNVNQSYYDYTGNFTIKNVAIGGASPMRWMDFSVTFGETPAMRGLYHLEGNVTDSSTNANHGTLLGGASFVPGRVHDQALSFNGIDGCVQIPYSVTNDFSITFWVNTTDTGGAGAWYNGKGLVDATVGPATNDFGITLINNRAAFGVGTPDTTIYSTSAINNGQWHHVAATRNSTSGEMRLYIDGVQQAIATGPVGPLALATGMRIGGLQTGSGFLNGSIDEVMINNFLLSPAEVSTLAKTPFMAYNGAQLYADLRANPTAVVGTVWTNQVALGNFARVGAPALVTNVAGTGISGVLFNGTSDAYQGPNTTSDLDGASDRTIEVWTYNPSLATEETMVSWGHRGSNRRNLGFNFGSDAGFGAVTHYNDDVGWGTAPTANAWHHLVYTYSNQVARVYLDGNLQNSKSLGGALNTFAGEPINIACQRDTANGNRSFFYSGYINMVRIHGAALAPEQVYANFVYGTWTPSVAPATPPTLVATTRNAQVRLSWGFVPNAVGYNLKRGTNSGGPYVNIANGLTTTNFTDTNVLNGVTYYYVMSAGNLYGQSTNSGEAVATATISPMPIVAGPLYVDLRATDSSAAAATWFNNGTLGDFAKSGSASLNNNVAGIPGVLFNGSTDFYQGPNSVSDIDGGGDRTVEIWAYNPSLTSEETPVSWGHRGTTRRNMAFNFGNNGTWGAATHYGDDVGWGTAPTAGAWHHLVFTYATNLVSVYVDGALRNTKGLAGALDTFPGEPIYIACQREAGGTSSMFYSGYLNTVRIHGGVLTAAQVQSNFVFGPWVPNSAPTLAPITDKVVTAGAWVTVTPSASDANQSQQTLKFSLPTGPGGAIFSTNTGVFSWHPVLAQAGTTNPVTIMVADNGSPVMSASRSFNVMVVPPVQPNLGSATLSNGVFQLLISGDQGPNYTVQWSSNLVSWQTILITNPPTMPFQFFDPAASNFDQRFYRVFIDGP